MHLCGAIETIDIDRKKSAVNQILFYWLIQQMNDAHVIAVC